MKLVKIGQVGVDTGHLIIIDPAYTERVNDYYNNWYTGNNSSKQTDNFVSFVSGEGDGDYPVYAILAEDEGILGVMVWFYEDELPYPVVESEAYRKRFPLEVQE